MKRTVVSAAIATIASETLGICRLDIRSVDAQYFHDLHVGRVATVTHIFTTNQNGD